MLHIILCCPECGSQNLEYSDGGVAEFMCLHCGTICDIEDMPAKVVDENYKEVEDNF